MVTTLNDLSALLETPLAADTPATPVRIANLADPVRHRVGFRELASATASSGPTPITLPDEAHALTFAPTGSGKGVNCAIPALLQFEGPAAVFDPKAELAAVTARARIDMGQRVFGIDPLGMTGLPRACLNPLDLVEPDAADAVDQARVIANYLMPARFDSRDVFWRNRAVHFLSSAILSAVHDYPVGQRNLITVRDIVHKMAKATSRSRSPGDLDAVQSIHPDANKINDLLDVGSVETVGGMVQTALEGVGFIQGPLMEESLGSSSFSLDDITDGVPMTIYLVLPPHMLHSHSGLLRLWFGTLFGALTRRRARPARSTLLMIDEAAQLGEFDPLRTAITLLRGYGVQTWSFWQDVTQMQTIYPRDWRSMVNNSAIVQLFGLRGHVAWREAAQQLGIDLPEAEIGKRMLLQADGDTLLADRIDYRIEPMFAGRFDSNPAFQRITGSLRRPLPKVAAKPRTTTPAAVNLDVFAQIAAAVASA